MKYYDIATRKRPDYRELLNSFEGGSVVCLCGIILCNCQIVFEHWQQGHFDKYDEV